MKLILALFAVLTIAGQGQAHQFPDFGEGPLHEDIQDILDLVPGKEIYNVAIDYIQNDPEVQAAVNYLLTSTILKDFMVDFEAVAEVINLLNYMQKEGVDIYSLINKLNRDLDIDELVPPLSYKYPTTMDRTGGLAGLFKDIKRLFNYDDYIRIYVHKMKVSQAFVGFIEQLKSDNFQQIVNKVCEIKSFRFIMDHLKSHGVSTQVLTDVMFIVLGITVPNSEDYNSFERTLEEELMDFVHLIPIDKYVDILLKYIAEDEQVQKAMQYLYTTEFHDLLRSVETLKEHQALVIYLQKAGISVVDYIQSFHEAIGMEDYVPPVIESTIKSQFGVQEVGDGMKGMLKELYDILPLKEIDALYHEKLQNSKVFADFIAKLKSPEMQKLIDNLYGNNTYREFVMKTRENGLELQELMKFTGRIFGLKFPY